MLRQAWIFSNAFLPQRHFGPAPSLAETPRTGPPAGRNRAAVQAFVPAAPSDGASEWNRREQLPLIADGRSTKAPI